MLLGKHKSSLTILVVAVLAATVGVVVVSCKAQTRNVPAFQNAPSRSIEDFFAIKPVGQDITGRKFYDIKSNWGAVARIPIDNDFVGISENKIDHTDRQFYFSLNDPAKTTTFGKPISYMYIFENGGDGRTKKFTGSKATDINSEPWRDTGERVFGYHVFSNGYTGFKCSELRETNSIGPNIGFDPLPEIGWEDEFHRRKVNSDGVYEYSGRGFGKEYVEQRPWPVITGNSHDDVWLRSSLNLTGVVYRIKTEKMDIELDCNTYFRAITREDKPSPGEQYVKEIPYYKYNFECHASMNSSSGFSGSLDTVFFEVNHSDDCHADLQLVAENAYKIFEKSISFELR